MDLSGYTIRLEEAAEFLGVSTDIVMQAVIKNVLHCGVIAKNWTGVALPSRDDIPRGPNGHEWRSGIQKIYNRDNRDFLYSYWLAGTGVRYSIRTAVLGHFWYLHHTDAYRLFVIEPDGIDVKFLTPVDGEFHHRMQPTRYPEKDFVVFVDDESAHRRITLKDLRFLYRDLEKFKNGDGEHKQKIEEKGLIYLSDASDELSRVARRLAKRGGEIRHAGRRQWYSESRNKAIALWQQGSSLNHIEMADQLMQDAPQGISRRTLADHLKAYLKEDNLSHLILGLRQRL